MPVDYLTEEQEQRYGRYVGDTSREQLARYFHLDDADHTLIAQRRGDQNRLGFGVQIGTLRFLGTFLPEPVNVPIGVIAYVASQPVIADPQCITQYAERVQTRAAIMPRKFDNTLATMRPPPLNVALPLWWSETTLI